MSSISVETVDGRTAFQPGDEIEVELGWELEEPPRSIELRVVWNTAGKGTTDLHVARTERLDEPSASERRRVTLALPHAPYSFSGKLVAIVWALEAVALPQETSARLEIVIAPGGTEVCIADALTESH